MDKFVWERVQEQGRLPWRGRLLPPGSVESMRIEGWLEFFVQLGNLDGFSLSQFAVRFFIFLKHPLRQPFLRDPRPVSASLSGPPQIRSTSCRYGFSFEEIFRGRRENFRRVWTFFSHKLHKISLFPLFSSFSAIPTLGHFRFFSRPLGFNSVDWYPSFCRRSFRCLRQIGGFFNYLMKSEMGTRHWGKRQ